MLTNIFTGEDIVIGQVVVGVLYWVAHTGLRIAITLLAAELVIRMVHRMLGRIIHRAVNPKRFPNKKDREQREKTLLTLLSPAVRVAIWVAAIIVILTQLGVNLTALAAGAGFFGLVVGIGAQSFITDTVSGFFIILENQFRIGDIVSINNVSGKVEDITMRTTILRDLDGQVHYIENGEIKLATNMTMQFAKINMDVGVSYDSDIDKVERVMNDVGKELAEDENWETYFIEPIQFARIENFSDSSIVVKVLGEVKPGKQWKVAGEYRRRLKKAFDTNNIEIPLPQRVVHRAKHK